MRLRINVFLLGLCIATVGCRVAVVAQDITTPVLKGNVSVVNSVYNYIHTNYLEVLSRNCGKGCFFVRFQIDTNGKIINLESNKGAWLTLDTLVKTAILSTSGQWISGKQGAAKVISKPFMLPVFFSTGNCIDTGARTKGSAAAILEKLPALSDSLQDKMGHSFMNMTNFNHSVQNQGEQAAYFECILLQPIYLSAPRI